MSPPATWLTFLTVSPSLDFIGIGADVDTGVDVGADADVGAGVGAVGTGADAVVVGVGIGDDYMYSSRDVERRPVLCSFKR